MQPQRQLKPRQHKVVHPFTKFWFRQYHISDTVRDLADILNGKVLKLEGSQYRKKNGHVLINWGSTQPLPGCDLNKPENVAVAVSKRGTFRVLQAAGVPIPQWTENPQEALSWNGKVVGRDSDNGRGGQGITIYKRGENLRPHLFYSSYFKKRREFRIHVFKDKVIFEQEKLKKKGEENADKYIRSHDRGWCFAFKHLADEPVPDNVRTAARMAVAAIGLDFGAVDIGWNPDNGACVFEVNTAPGLEESSLLAYTDAIRELQ